MLLLYFTMDLQNLFGLSAVLIAAAGITWYFTTDSVTTSNMMTVSDCDASDSYSGVEPSKLLTPGEAWSRDNSSKYYLIFDFYCF